MNHQSSRFWRVAMRTLDRLRWRGRIRTVLRGPAAGLRIGSSYSSAEYAEGMNEFPVQEAVVANLRAGSTFYDIGANVGFFALLAARSVGPGGKVVAFEAVPEIARCITDNAAINGFDQIEVRSVAVGAAPGTAELRLTSHPGGATLAQDSDATDLTTTTQTEVCSVDSLLAARSLPVPDLVKIDVEGHEQPVLSGMEKTLAVHKPVLLIELDAANADRLAHRRDELEQQLTTLGYSAEELPKSYIGTDWEVIHLLATAR